MLEKFEIFMKNGSKSHFFKNGKKWKILKFYFLVQKRCQRNKIQLWEGNIGRLPLYNVILSADMCRKVEGITESDNFSINDFPG